MRDIDETDIQPSLKTAESEIKRLLKDDIKDKKLRAAVLNIVLTDDQKRKAAIQKRFDEKLFFIKQIRKG